MLASLAAIGVGSTLSKYCLAFRGTLISCRRSGVSLACGGEWALLRSQGPVKLSFLSVLLFAVLSTLFNTGLFAPSFGYCLSIREAFNSVPKPLRAGMQRGDYGTAVAQGLVCLVFIHFMYNLYEYLGCTCVLHRLDLGPYLPFWLLARN